MKDTKSSSEFLIPTSLPVEKHKTRENRILRTLSTLILSLIAGVFLWRAHYRRDAPGFGFLESGMNFGNDACVGLHNDLTAGDGVELATLTLPVHSERLFVISRSPFRHGELNIVQGNESFDEMEVQVIGESFGFDKALSAIKVCPMRLGDGATGVGIFAPNAGIQRMVTTGQLVVNVTVPPATGDNPLRFDTWLRNFDINVESLSLEEGHLETTDGSITGHYRSSNKLDLITSNGNIDVSIDLYNDDDFRPAQLLMKTSNGRLDSDLSYYVSTSEASEGGGAFDIIAETSNGILSLNHLAAPVNSTLSLDARTSNAKADIFLHPTYEGTYIVSTSNNHIYQNQPKKRDDPADLGRQRHYQTSSGDENHLKGRTWWGDEEHSLPGDVVLKTSNAPVTVRF